VRNDEALAVSPRTPEPMAGASDRRSFQRRVLDDDRLATDQIAHYDLDIRVLALEVMAPI
jgi:hypothetical protein